MSRSLRTVIQSANAALGGFFRWWLGELDALLLDLAHRLGSRWRRTLLVKVTSDSLDLTSYRGGRVDWYGVCPRTALQAPDDEYWRRLPRIARMEVLRDWYLCVPAAFPVAARQHLRSAVELRVARISPLPPSETYYTYTTPSSDDSGVNVSIALVRRQPVDDMVAALRKCGISVRSLELEAGESGRARLPLDQGTPLPPAITRRFNQALAALSVIGLLAFAWAWHDRFARTQSALDAAYATVKDGSVHDLELRSSLEREQRVLADLRGRLAPSPSSVLLAALHKALPPPIWLQSMDIRGREAHLTLYVPPRAEVARLLLENSSIQSVTENSRVSLGVGITEERVELFVVLAGPSA